MTAFAMRRLDFRLHDFTRCSWASDQAREVWQPRIRQIMNCWRELEWLAVAAGLWPCTIALLPAEMLATFAARMAEHGLDMAILDQISAPRAAYITRHTQAKPGEPSNYRVAIGAAHTLETFKAAWSRDDQHIIRELLGYPDCCRDFFEAMWVREKFIDTTWPMALNTTTKRSLSAHIYEVQGPPQANILLRWLGVRAVPHLPCRFDCAATVERAQQLLALGRSAGYALAMEWLQEILQWPVEWSSLHGIAEIKTPIARIVTVSDATADKHVVRRPGDRYPEAGAQGLVFPYRTPIRLRSTDSRSFQRGITHSIERYEE